MSLDSSQLVVLPVVLPLLAGVLLFIVPARLRARAGLAGALATALTALPIPFQVLHGGTRRQALAGWAAPLGIEIRADGLSALLMLFAALMGLCISLYAFAYFTAKPSDDPLGLPAGQQPDFVEPLRPLGSGCHRGHCSHLEPNLSSRAPCPPRLTMASQRAGRRSIR